jgi:type I restriction enzyme S subunit
MTPDRLLDHFDRISDAPDAIPRLRQFILELAVRGKLVDRDPRDEPASELLKRVHSEKERRIREGQMKKQEAFFEVRTEEAWFELPASWYWVRLGAIAQVVMGQSPKGDTYNKTGDGIPLINGPVEFTEGPFGKTVINQYTTAPTNICEEGDLLLCVRGSTTGRTNIAGFRACIGRGVAAIRPFFADQYVRLFIWRLRAAIIAMGRGIVFPSVSRQQIEELPVPLPPLAEQHRIVGKVDELMALCDRLEASQVERESRRNRLAAATLHRLNNGADADAFREHARFHIRHLPRLTTRPEHIHQLRQTILNLAVRGKMVPQDPNDEPASELLNRIQGEKKRMMEESAIKRLNPSPPIDAAEVLAEVPDSWIWVRLSDLMCGESRNGYSRKPDDALDGIPILRISAGTVRRDGIVAEEEHKLIAGVSAAQREQYRLEPGDLLACRFNGNRGFVGRLSLYLGYLGINPIYPDKLIRLRLFSQFVLPPLVRCFAESNVVRRDIESYCATTVGNWGISASNLKLVKFPLPPLAEQKRIAAKVQQLMALCDRLEAQLATTQNESRRMLEAALHEAVNGH